jgi:hypothetical protein
MGYSWRIFAIRPAFIGDRETLQRSRPFWSSALSGTLQVNYPAEVRCKRCQAIPRLAHKILDVRTGGSLRMYKCECGEQMWFEMPV